MVYEEWRACFMEKLEILKRSKEENKLQDERDTQYDTKSYANALIIYILMAWCYPDNFTVTLASAKYNLGTILLIPAMLGSGSCRAFRYYYFRDVKELIWAIVLLGLTLGFLIELFIVALS